MFEVIEREMGRPLQTGSGGTYWEQFGLLRLYLGDFLADVRTPAGRVGGYLISGRVVTRGSEPGSSPAGWLRPEMQWEWERLQERLHQAGQAIEAMAVNDGSSDAVLRQELVGLLRGLTLSLRREDLVFTDQARFALLGWGMEGGFKAFQSTASVGDFLAQFARVHGLSDPEPATRWARQSVPVSTPVLQPAYAAAPRPATPPAPAPAVQPVLQSQGKPRSATRPWLGPVLGTVSALAFFALGWVGRPILTTEAPKRPVNAEDQAPAALNPRTIEPKDKEVDLSSVSVVPYDVVFGYRKTAETAESEPKLDALLLVQLSEATQESLRRNYVFGTPLSTAAPPRKAYLAFDLSSEQVLQAWGYHRSTEVKLLKR